MKIYTRTGDEGVTSLLSGERVPKFHLRLETYGTVDELNSHLGAARAEGLHALPTALTARLQEELFLLGADLAAATTSPRPGRMSPDHIRRLESEIDEMTEQLPPLRHFILPGGTPAAAQLHLARTVCRRAERMACQLVQAGEEVNPAALMYLNRLSDHLFTLARWENALQSVPETEWVPGRGKKS